jgi:hypothetical protein
LAEAASFGSSSRIKDKRRLWWLRREASFPACAASFFYFLSAAKKKGNFSLFAADILPWNPLSWSVYIASLPINSGMGFVSMAGLLAVVE